MRYELVVHPHFEFRDPRSDGGLSPFSVACRDHTFVWHPARTENNDLCAPVVSLMQTDADGITAGVATYQFVAGLSYALDRPIGLGWSTATGFKQALDPPLACDPGLRAATAVAPITGLVMDEDDSLRRVMGLFREGLAAESPYYRFLALHNALVASFDGSETEAERYATTNQARVHDRPADTDDLGRYFRDVLRNAIAHAVRSRDKPTLDPNDPRDHAKAAQAVPAIRQTVRWRVEERWPGAIAVVTD